MVRLDIAWGAKKEDMRHLIKYAELDDGIHWVRDNLVAIDFSGPDEYAICKPCIRQDGEVYRMWFCARGKAYRIYHAQSDDGIAWRRTPEPAIDVSDSGWDSEMVEYPFVFDHGGDRYMLYAGNGFGKAGFGIAILNWDLTHGPRCTSDGRSNALDRSRLTSIVPAVARTHARRRSHARVRPACRSTAAAGSIGR